jgi:hypothetical protein
MTGYLEGYGVIEARREKTIKRILLALLVVVVAGGTLYLVFRNYREKQQIQLFFELLRNQNYQAAYELWGCTESHPCPDYPMQKFMEDWGPKSPRVDIADLKITRTRGCSTGVIFQVDVGKSEPEYLWVDRGNKLIGFAPWPVCNPRLPANLH